MVELQITFAVVLCYVVCGTEDGTQGLVHARQVFHHRAGASVFAVLITICLIF